MPDFLCFNTDRRDFAGWYGAGAFYDLPLTPREDRKFARLKPGDVCVVATPTKDRRQVVLGWFSFRNDKLMRDPKPKKPGTNVQARVLFGTWIPPKRTATFEFFKVKGGFKRGLTITAVEPV